MAAVKYFTVIIIVVVQILLGNFFLIHYLQTLSKNISSTVQKCDSNIVDKTSDYSNDLSTDDCTKYICDNLEWPICAQFKRDTEYLRWFVNECEFKKYNCLFNNGENS